VTGAEEAAHSVAAVVSPVAVAHPAAAVVPVALAVAVAGPAVALAAIVREERSVVA
jgi:hypothetical protein